MKRQQPRFKNRSHEDMTHFGNRLYRLMESKKIYTSRELADQMFMSGMGNLVNSDEYSDDRNIKGSIQRRIENHLNAESVDSVPGKYLRAYCEFFGCSADYLFGMTEIKSSSSGVRDLCEILGLSEPAVMGLYKITGKGKNSIEWGWNSVNYRRILSKLFESEGFIRFVIGIRELGDAYEREQYTVDPLEEVYKKLGADLFKQAMEAYEQYDEEDETEASPELVEAVRLISEKMDEGYEQQMEQEKRNGVKVARFNLNEIFTEWVNEQFSNGNNHH